MGTLPRYHPQGQNHQALLQIRLRELICFDCGMKDPETTKQKFKEATDGLIVDASQSGLPDPIIIDLPAPIDPSLN